VAAGGYGRLGSAAFCLRATSSAEYRRAVTHSTSAAACRRHALDTGDLYLESAIAAKSQQNVDTVSRRSFSDLVLERFASSAASDAGV